MKVLAILYAYPPLLYPATMCYLKLVIGLTELGVNVDVLTVDPETFVGPGDSVLIDQSLVNLLPKSVANHKVRSWESKFLLRQLKQRRATYRLFYHLFEPRKREWVAPAIKVLNSLDLGAYDAVLSCSQPHSNHLVGHYIKERTHKPWVAYLSDPWVDHSYGQYSTPKIFRYNSELEKRVITKADRVLFTSPETTRLVMQKYDVSLHKKAGELPHCFNPGWYNLIPSPRDWRSRSKISIVHTGHFYGPRTPVPFFEALERLAKERPLHNELEVSFFGTMGDSHVRFLSEHNLGGIVNLKTTIPYLESLSRMVDSDFLLLIDAPLTGHNESVYLPSKLIDYIGSGKPIIGLTPSHGRSAIVLRETGNLTCDVNDVESITDILRSLLSSPAGRLTSGTSGGSQYHYINVSRQLLNVLQQACQTGARPMNSVTA